MDGYTPITIFISKKDDILNFGINPLIAIFFSLYVLKKKKKKGQISTKCHLFSDTQNNFILDLK